MSHRLSLPVGREASPHSPAATVDKVGYLLMGERAAAHRAPLSPNDV
jgi:hypothetical protein